ncbi:MAG: metallophosphoesterase family protein [Solirubrobacteraceae bacterium]|jgi:putative phosphoesterase
MVGAPPEAARSTARIAAAANDSETERQVRRVGVIADVHANLPALIAGLRELERIGVDAVYAGGDLVGYGPHPIGVCQLLQSRSIASAYGDHDYAVGHDLAECCRANATAAERELARRSLAWTRSHSDGWTREFLRSLPFDLRFTLGAKSVRLMHGSPRSAGEYLFEDQPAVVFEQIAAESDCDVLVFGGSHRPWIGKYAGVLFVNCGSVGQPDDRDPRPTVALLELSRDGDVHASIEPVPFNVLNGGDQTATAAGQGTNGAAR